MGILFPGNSPWCPTARGETHSIAGRGSMIRKWKTDMQGPALICRPARSICRIVEGIEREKKNLIAGQGAILRRLRRYMH